MTDYIQWIRSRVGTRKIFLVFGGIVVGDGNGRILLQRRTDFDFWGLPGGALELDEDIATCARREVREETGLEVGELRFSGLYSDPRYDVVYPNGDQVQQFTICFVAQAAGGHMRVDGIETTDQRFFTPAEIAELRLPLWYRDMVADALTSAVPRLRPPVPRAHTCDQIDQIRPFVGNDRFTAVGATALVQREDGRFLMIQRRDDGAWVFPAGFCDIGENLADTAVRETREETGLTIQPQRLVGIYSSPQFHHTYSNGHAIKNVGACVLATPTGGCLQPDPEEVADIAWVAAADVPQQATDRYAPFYEQVLAAAAGGDIPVW